MSAGLEPDPRTRRMPRVDALTGFRWWAALFVFGGHVQGLAPLPWPAPALLSQGHFGVTFFFVLSGFVLTWSASPSTRMSTFYWRRFARIYPSHLVALLVAIPVFYDIVYTLTSTVAPAWVKPFDPGVIALSFPVIQAWWNDPDILFSGNPAAWTLTCEAFFYFLHPFLLRLLWRLPKGATLVASGFVIAAMVAFRIGLLANPEGWLSAVPTPVVHLPEFVLGACLAWAMRCGWTPRVPVTLGIAFLGVVILAIAYGAERPVLGEVARFSDAFVTLACAVAIVAVASRMVRGRRSLLAHPLLVLLGEWSFGFYLVHATVLYAALLFMVPPAPSWLNLLWIAVWLLAALAASAALHYGVERPAEKRIRAWAERRAARRGAAEPARELELTPDR